MAKVYDKCKLCGATKFLNGIGLCKKCNKSKESAIIKNKETMKRKARIETSKAEHKKEEEIAKETAEIEENENTTDNKEKKNENK